VSKDNTQEVVMILVTLFRVTRSANTPHPGMRRDARNLNFKVVFIKLTAKIDMFFNKAKIKIFIQTSNEKEKLM